MHQQTSFQDTHGWKLDLIARRARRLGLRGPDIDDAVQDLALDVLDFDYDPQRAGGASEPAVLAGVIDNRLISLLRSRERYQMHLARMAADLHPDSEIDDAQDLTRCELRSDVRDLINALPTDHQDVCHKLMDGESLAEIADDLGCGWHTVRRMLDRIRATFVEAGIEL
ncbi:MAG: RNA polymerase sigma factor [Planctomycetota bacterium]|jgi:RNA polymerase sigma factor (sigma-70 family)